MTHLQCYTEQRSKQRKQAVSQGSTQHCLCLVHRISSWPQGKTVQGKVETQPSVSPFLPSTQRQAAIRTKSLSLKRQTSHLRDKGDRAGQAKPGPHRTSWQMAGQRASGGWNASHNRWVVGRMRRGRRLNAAQSSSRLLWNLLGPLLHGHVHFRKMHQAPHYDVCPLHLKKKFSMWPSLSNSARENTLQTKLLFSPMTGEKDCSFVPKSKNGETKNSFGPARYHKKQDRRQRPSQPQLQIKMQNRNGYRSKDSETNPEEHRENYSFVPTYHIRGKEYLVVGNKSGLKFFFRTIETQRNYSFSHWKKIIAVIWLRGK